VQRRKLSAPGAAVASASYNIVSLVRGATVDPWTLVIGLPGAQELDSLAVEADGAICVGTVTDSGITVVFPEENSCEKYTLPDRVADAAVTNICFGGSDLRTAYVTLSLTGRLVACPWPRPGLRLAYQELPSSVA
jgi:gluconolactonase